MKRLLALIAALLMLLSAPVLADPKADAADFAARMLPEFAFVNGVQFEKTAMLLVQDAEGTLYFAGCAKDGTDWVITLSTPLPEGTWANTYHSYEGVLEIGLPDDNSCTIALESDGRWLLCHTADTSISEDLLWFGMIGPYYGDVLMERDVTRLDWTRLPASYEDFLPLVDASRWAVVTGDGAPLYAGDGSILAAYLPATPVLLLEDANGQHRVAINGGSITGWIDDKALLIGENQLTVDEEGYLAVVEDGFVWGSASFICDEPIPLYDAPEGAVIGETGFRIDLLARYPDGWLHVLDVETGLDGFIREDSVVSLNAWVDALCEEYSLN